MYVLCLEGSCMLLGLSKSILKIEILEKRNHFEASQKWQNDLCLIPRQTIQYYSNPSLWPNH